MCLKHACCWVSHVSFTQATPRALAALQVSFSMGTPVLPQVLNSPVLPQILHSPVLPAFPRNSILPWSLFLLYSVKCEAASWSSPSLLWDLFYWMTCRSLCIKSVPPKQLSEIPQVPLVDEDVTAPISSGQLLRLPPTKEIYLQHS